MIHDPTALVSTRFQDLLIEAERDRLAAQLPRRRSVVRHSLAVTCERVAQWLDRGADRYVQPSQSGPANWAA